MKIEDMDFSIRTYNCLKHSGFNFSQQLTNFTDDELRSKIRNISAAGIKELREKLDTGETNYDRYCSSQKETCEMHVWLGDDYPDSCIFSYASTNMAFKKKQRRIDTTQIHFFNGLVIDKGYRLFLHYPSGKAEEVAYGSNNMSTSRELRPGHNLEKLMLNGEFDNIDYDNSLVKE